VGPHTLIKKMDGTVGHVTTVQIDCFKVKSAPSWCYTTFQYVLEDGELFGGELRTLTSYSQQQKRSSDDDDRSTRRRVAKQLRRSSSVFAVEEIERSPCVVTETTGRGASLTAAVSTASDLPTVATQIPPQEKENTLINVTAVQPPASRSRSKNVPTKVRQIIE